MSKPAFSSYQIATDLLRIEALKVYAGTPFDYSGGYCGPVYCDNRLTLSDPPIREQIADAFAQCVQSGDSLPDAIVAVATAGIPHAAWLAHKLSLPMAYVRTEAKSYGLKKQIEGRLPQGAQTVVVEDLVFSGRSSLIVVDALSRATGRTPDMVLSIFTYGYPGVAEKFTAAGTRLIPLCDLGTMLRVARHQSLVDQAMLETIEEFRQNPRAWSDRQRALLS